MPRLTVQALKAACSWEQVLNLAPTDSRWLQYLNQTLERFTHMALWDRTVEPIQVCVNQACLTWPRRALTLEVIDICRRPFPVRNQWFEYLENGPGLATLKGCSTYNVMDRGRGYAMFDDLTVASKIRLYPQFAGDVGKTVVIRGNDSNGREVLTNGGNTEGEVLTIASPFVDSATTWAPQIFREVIKAVTKGHITAWGYDALLPVPPASPGPNDTPLKALADWEPGETLPDYRRSFIPYLDVAAKGGGCGCRNDNTSCDKVSVRAMIKLCHVPVVSDLDFLLISSISALKLGMLSVMLEERQDWVGARQAWQGTFDPYLKRYTGGAVQALEDELSAFQGDGTIVPVRLESSSIDRATVTNLI